MCQPGRPTPHGAFHDVSSPSFVAFQSAKSRGSSFAGFGSCSARPDRASGRTAHRRSRTERRGSTRRPFAVYAWPLASKLLDQHDDLRHRLRGERKRIGHPETEALRVLEVPGGRLEGSLGAPAGRGLVDLVVDVGDVVHEPYRMAPLAQPPRQPREDDEGPGVADVGPLVDRRATDVDPDRLGRRRKLDERARQRVLQTHCAIVVGRGSASAPPLRPLHALERLVRRQRKDDGPELRAREAHRSTRAGAIAGRRPRP